MRAQESRASVQLVRSVAKQIRMSLFLFSKAAVELIRAELRKNQYLIQTVRKQYAKSTRKGKGVSPGKSSRLLRKLLKYVKSHVSVSGITVFGYRRVLEIYAC